MTSTSAASTRPETAGPPALPARTARTRPGPAKPDTSLVLGPVDTAAGAARATLRAMLQLWGLPGLIDDGEVIAGELVANAVTASRDAAPPGTEPRLVIFRLTVEAGEGELCIRVWDPDPGPPPPDPALPDDDDMESGRGLFLVCALASRWGWHPGANGGKHVWATLRLDACLPQSPQPP